jgi:hypothetical protein
MAARDSWLRQAVADGQSNKVSTKRIIMLVAGISMSVSTLGLVVAVFFGWDVSGPLVAFGTSLSALAGAGYVGGKAMENKAPRNDNT